MGVSKENVMKRIFDYVEEYRGAFRKPIRLQYVARMFGKLARALGSDVKTLLEDDGRFRLTLEETGGYVVEIRGKETVSLNALIITLLQKNAGLMPRIELTGECLTSGHDLERIARTLEYMTNIGVVEFEGKSVRLILKYEDKPL